MTRSYDSHSIPHAGCRWSMAGWPGFSPSRFCIALMLAATVVGLSNHCAQASPSPSNRRPPSIKSPPKKPPTPSPKALRHPSPRPRPAPSPPTKSPPFRPAESRSSRPPPPRPPPPPPPPLPHPSAGLESYPAYGDELLVLSVQPDSRWRTPDARTAPPAPPPSAPPPRGEEAIGDDELRLFFTVGQNYRGPQLPDQTWPLVYRRLDYTSAVTPDVYGAFETGDTVTIFGQHRIAQRLVAPAAGAAVDLACGLDEETDSDYILASQMRRTVNSYYLDRLSIQLSPIKNVTSITFILNVCDRANPLKPEDLRPYWDGNPTDGPSLKQFFDDCTHGIEPFHSERNLIVGPIDVPCSETPGNGRTFDSQRCTDREVFGWAQYAMDYVRQALPNVSLGMRDPERRIFLFPDMPACGSWESLASVGCGRSCPVFLKLTNSSTGRSVASQLIHDLGHTYSLSHSAAVARVLPRNNTAGPRADSSCPMGSAAAAPGPVCPNAANGWKNGWTTILNMDNRNNVTAGFRGVLRLPPTSARADSVAVLHLPPAMKRDDDPTKNTTTTYYISYRLPSAQDTYDRGLPGDRSGLVYVHQYDGSTARFGSVSKPVLVGSSTGLQQFEFVPLPLWATSYFTVRLEKADATGASVRLCLKGNGGLPAREATEDTCELCTDGVDNDCDGRTDEQDPYCQEFCRDWI